jgi:hypothetical protein
MNQTGITHGTVALADQLVALEAASSGSPISDNLATVRVCEKLRRPLIILAGTAGFASLLSRALTLARRESPQLSAVQVRPDGDLENLDGQAVEAHPILVAYLLGLLNTFIGETLTMRLLNDTWQDLPISAQSLLGKDSK